MSLTVNNISFSYSQGQQVLDNISFSVKPGEIVCFLGASGCGKSTLMKIIAGLLPNNKKNIISGSVIFNEESVDELKEKGKLSFMFQEPTLMPNLSVKQNIQFPTKILKKSFHYSVEDTIKIVGLTDSMNKLPKDLSGGMKTRTALARCFVTQPSLLLLDEPFSSLDYARRNSLYIELKTLQERDNTAIVMVTHNIDEAMELADRVILLGHNGKVIREYSFNKSVSTKRIATLDDGTKSLAASRWLEDPGLSIMIQIELLQDYNSSLEIK